MLSRTRDFLSRARDNRKSLVSTLSGASQTGSGFRNAPPVAVLVRSSTSLDCRSLKADPQKLLAHDEPKPEALSGELMRSSADRKWKSDEVVEVPTSLFVVVASAGWRSDARRTSSSESSGDAIASSQGAGD